MIKILHVDDDQPIHILLSHNLLDLENELEFVFVDSGTEAMEILNEKSFDCIISDFQMPNMDGLEFLKTLRERKDNTPFIFLTGQGNEKIAVEAFHCGADDYFTKDYGFANYERILNSIKKQINRKEISEELNKRLKELTALHTLNKKMISDPLLAQVLDAGIRGIVNLFAVDLGIIFLRKDDKLSLQTSYLSSTKISYKEVAVHCVGECLCGLAVSTGKPIYCLDINKDPRCTLYECKNAGFISFAALPLHVGENIIGVLGLASAKSRDFENSHEILETFSNTMAMATQNALSFEEVKHREYQLVNLNRELQVNIADLKKSEEKFKTLAYLAPIGIYMTDTFGKCTYVNQRWSKMAGLSEKEAQGDGWINGIHPDDREGVFSSWKKTVEANGCWGTEYRFLNNEDKVTWVYGLAAKLNNQAGELSGYIGVNMDITERKIADAKLDRINVELSDKNKDMERFVDIVAHDLKSPVVTLKGFIKVLETSHIKLRPILEKAESESEEKELRTLLIDGLEMPIKYINRCASKMERLVQSILNFSRVGRVAFDVIDIDMNNLISKVKSTFEFIAKEKNITIEVCDLPPCRGDMIQIDQVFSNLIGNALKYLDTNRQGFIRISGNIKGNNVIYCVEDNGIGIPKTMHEKVFEIFHRIDPASSVEGEGLGLAIVDKIISRHRGKVWVESEPDKGSKFFVSLNKIMS